MPESLQFHSLDTSENRYFDPTHYDFKPYLESCAAIDLFCGVGGLTYGLQASGIQVVAGLDTDINCQFPFESNNASHFLHEDICLITGADLSLFYPQDGVRILVGCAPCQDFSRYSRGKRANDSGRWTLLREFGRLVHEINPEIVSMENVPELQLHSIYGEFLDVLKENGYYVDTQCVYCPAYGVPQTRERIVLLASTLGPISLIPPLFDSPLDYPQLSHAIEGMEAISAGQSSPSDALHRSSRLSATNLKRIEHSKPGGTWRDWPMELRNKCHMKESGATYSGVYGRMEWDKPAPTLTTQFFGYGNGRFGHPEQHRAISLREGAILQSFPKDYRFLRSDEKIIFDRIGRLIGNAVPPRLGEAVGKSIRLHIENWRKNV